MFPPLAAVRLSYHCRWSSAAVILIHTICRPPRTLQCAHSTALWVFFSRAERVPCRELEMANNPGQALLVLARRLLAIEAADDEAASQQPHVGARVSEKLRFALSRFAGADGFAALMYRAAALAKAEVPALNTVQAQPNGTVEGLEGVDEDAAALLIAHLLRLLVTFVGEPIALRLIREAWPDVPLDQLTPQ